MDFIRDANVVGFRPGISAAPFSPATFQAEASSAATIFARCVWIPNSIIPSDATVAFATDADFDFGVLQSRIHETWAPEESIAIESESGSVDMVKFDLDKTYTAWFECQKKWAASISLFVIVTTTLAVSVFADEPKDGFTIPFVGLTLKKWYAVELLTVIQVASFYRFVAMGRYRNVLNLKFRKVLVRLGDSGYHWHWSYPSVSGFSGNAGDFHKRYVIIYYAMVGILIVGGFLFPVLCLYIVFTETVARKSGVCYPARA